MGSRWWDQSAPTKTRCPVCGHEVTRKRGNLSGPAYRNAIARQLALHVAKHAPAVESGVARP